MTHLLSGYADGLQYALDLSPERFQLTSVPLILYMVALRQLRTLGQQTIDVC